MDVQAFYDQLAIDFQDVLATVDQYGTELAYDPETAQAIVAAGGFLRWTLQSELQDYPFQGGDGPVGRAGEDQFSNFVHDGVPDFPCYPYPSHGVSPECLVEIASHYGPQNGGGTSGLMAAGLSCVTGQFSAINDLLQTYIPDYEWSADQLEMQLERIRSIFGTGDVDPIMKRLGIFPESLSATLRDALAVYDDPAGSSIDVASFLSECSILIGGKEVNLLSGLMYEFDGDRLTLDDALTGLVYASSNERNLKALAQLVGISHYQSVVTK